MNNPINWKKSITGIVMLFIIPSLQQIDIFKSFIGN